MALEDPKVTLETPPHTPAGLKLRFVEDDFTLPRIQDAVTCEDVNPGTPLPLDSIVPHHLPHAHMGLVSSIFDGMVSYESRLKHKFVSA